MFGLREEIKPVFGQTEMMIAFTVTVILFILWFRSKSNSLKSFLIANPPKDTVILHQYGKGLTVPSISPFVIKLETYLRAAKIPYINKYSRKPGPKGKLPWIQYNDRVIPDSQFCIEFLNGERNVDLNKHLEPGQLAVGHLVRRTVEESVYWAMLMWRLVFEASGAIYRKLGLPSFIIWYMRYSAKPRLWSHGIGRHSQKEVTKLMEDDLKAVSQILGEKNFLFGNDASDVTEFDCALFGQLCQLIWQMPGTPVGEDIACKFPNLVAFCNKMKAAFWPDWDERLLHSSEKSHTDSSLNTFQEIVESPKMSSVGKEVPLGINTRTITSLKSNPITNGPLSSKSDAVVKLFNGDSRKRINTSYITHKVLSDDHMITALSSKVSAASILTNQTPIMPAP